jgi:two-component system cell cycle response regulator
MTSNRRIVLVDPDPETREVFAQRLRAQGFVVEEAANGVAGAEMALAAPPAAVISDLWMDGVSGVQLCRLLRAEPATADVPVVLRAEQDDARSRFWSRRAGARSLVMKGRMGELVRTLADVTAEPPEEDAFFFRLSGGEQDVRDRIAEHLDRALFESVVASEVRALANASAFDRLFDSLSQLATQLIDYRWLSLTTPAPSYFAIHAHRRQAAAAEAEARKVLLAPDSAKLVRILDDDAVDVATSERTVVHDIKLGGVLVGQLALGIPAGSSHVDTIAPLVARELGAVIRLVLLLEESQRLATTDGLTGLYNRRAFIEAMVGELARADRFDMPASFLVLDLDHFKVINDTHGHGAGDAVLAAVAKALKARVRSTDLVARWGGEEFVVALPNTNEQGAAVIAEALREVVANLRVTNSAKELIPLTVSIGAAQRARGEPLDSLVDRADRAMYAAKVNGRDRVCMASEGTSAPPSRGARASNAPPSLLTTAANEPPSLLTKAANEPPSLLTKGSIVPPALLTKGSIAPPSLLSKVSNAPPSLLSKASNTPPSRPFVEILKIEQPSH